MQSTRINKKGEIIPSIIDPWAGYNYSSEGYGHVRRHPYCDSGIMGNSEEDEAWIQERRARSRAASVLARETSLGANFVAANEIRDKQRPHTQEELNQFLVQMNRFAVGDFITFGSYNPASQQVGYSTISFLLARESTIEKVVWPEKENVPKPFLALDMTPCLPNHKPESSARFINSLYSRHLTTGEIAAYIKDNVLVQNHIQQAREALKAGTLTIRG